MESPHRGASSRRSPASRRFLRPLTTSSAPLSSTRFKESNDEEGFEALKKAGTRVAFISANAWDPEIGAHSQQHAQSIQGGGSRIPPSLSIRFVCGVSDLCGGAVRCVCGRVFCVLCLLCLCRERDCEEMRRGIGGM